MKQTTGRLCAHHGKTVRNAVHLYFEPLKALNQKFAAAEALRRHATAIAALCGAIIALSTGPTLTSLREIYCLIKDDPGIDAGDADPPPRTLPLPPQPPQPPPPRVTIGEASPIPEPPPIALPVSPKIAIVVVGDETLAQPLARELRDGLDRAGLPCDEPETKHVAELIAQAAPGSWLSRLLVALANEGFNLLVLGEIELLLEQPLGHFQPLTIKRGAVRFRAFAVRSPREIGSGWSRAVEYQGVSANDKARMVADPVVSPLAEVLRGYWKASAARNS